MSQLVTVQETFFEVFFWWPARTCKVKFSCTNQRKIVRSPLLEKSSSNLLNSDIHIVLRGRRHFLPSHSCEIVLLAGFTDNRKMKYAKVLGSFSIGRGLQISYEFKFWVFPWYCELPCYNLFSLISIRMAFICLNVRSPAGDGVINRCHISHVFECWKAFVYQGNENSNISFSRFLVRIVFSYCSWPLLGIYNRNCGIWNTHQTE